MATSLLIQFKKTPALLTLAGVRCVFKLACILLGLCPAAHAFEAGKDGAGVIAAANQIVNLYTTAPAGGTAGSNTLTVASAAGLAEDDLVLIYQAQGASIDTSNAYAYGTITSYNNAGRYELQSIRSISGSTLTFNCTLRFSYTGGRTQVIRVPLYSTLTVNGGASIVPAAWNGSTGGVVAVHVRDTATVNGSIQANGAGFRGGTARNNSGSILTSNTIFVTTDVNLGAEKGESIAGAQPDYDSLGGRVGRGAPANGGGGGDLHNAGGGGGANGDNGNNWLTSGGTVGGQGVMCTGCTGNTAWTLDPGYAANGNTRTNSAGGGRGGYSYASSNQNALTRAPGANQWGGDRRREVGGLGGRPLDNDPGSLTASRLFIGGGGGAGDQNNGVGGSGGTGGGVVLLIAGTLGGSGSIQANGNPGANTTGGDNDAPGGGGGGGSVVVVASAAGGVSFSATGGAGGLQLIGGNESEGPGGGGGGGYIAAPAAGTISGGANGTTTSGALTEFPTNGATSGGSGQSLAALANYPRCIVSAILSFAKTVTPLCDPTNGTSNPKLIPGAYARWQLNIANSAAANGSAHLTTIIDTLDANTLHDPHLIVGGSGTACSVAGTPENASGRGFKFSILGSTRPAINYPKYFTTAADADAAGLTGSTVNLNLQSALPAEAGYNAGRLRPGETATLEFNVSID
jgi:hypothetical protein